MNKCDNCYHYEMCSDIFDLDDMFEDCEHFKDKSLIIELPCKIGDVLFKVNYNVSTKRHYIDNIQCKSIEINEFGMSIYCKNVNNGYDIYSPDDFGQSVFTSHEDVKITNNNFCLKENKNKGIMERINCV